MPATKVADRQLLTAPGGGADLNPTAIKTPVRLMAAGNVTVANPGTATFDNVVILINERIALCFQTTASENGIYVFNTSATALVRATDMDAATEMQAGTGFYIAEGTIYGGSQWVLNTTGEITIGTTQLVFKMNGHFIKKLTADTTRNSVTLSDVVGLSFPVKNGKFYIIKVLVVFRSDTATVGAKVGFTYPAGTASGIINIPIANSGTSLLAVPIIATGGSGTGTAVGTINTDYLAVADFILKPTADGTFQVQAAIELGTTVVTYKAGSCITISEM